VPDHPPTEIASPIPGLPSPATDRAEKAAIVTGLAPVTAVSLATGVAGKQITVGEGPDSIAITPDGSTAYIVDYTGNTVTPISVAIDLPGKPITAVKNPIAIAISPEGSTAYVADWE
jgi:DNA-binding beta-propeller fold protein YncE